MPSPQMGECDTAIWARSNPLLAMYSCAELGHDEEFYGPVPAIHRMANIEGLVMGAQRANDRGSPQVVDFQAQGSGKQPPCVSVRLRTCDP
jgi:hypothetical protein